MLAYSFIQQLALPNIIFIQHNRLQFNILIHHAESFYMAKSIGLADSSDFSDLIALGLDLRWFFRGIGGRALWERMGRSASELQAWKIYQLFYELESQCEGGALRRCEILLSPGRCFLGCGGIFSGRSQCLRVECIPSINFYF